MKAGTANLIELSRVRALTRSGAARSIRLGAQLSLGEVARAIGTSAATILRWERAERVPHGELALRYGALLEELMRPSERAR